MTLTKFAILVLLIQLSACGSKDKNADTNSFPSQSPKPVQHSGINDIYPNIEPMLHTFLNDAGWCWYQDPRVIIKNHQLIVGGISGVSGDIRVSVYDLKSNSLLGERVLDKNFERDDHNAPVFYAKPNGSILAIWAKHGKENRHYYSVSKPNDFLSWSKTKIIEHEFTIPDENYWGGVTYMNLYSIKNKHTLYNFFRLGLDLNPYFVSSTDNGESWNNKTHFITDNIEGTHRPYNRYSQATPNKIAVSFTDGHPRQFGNSLYYAEFDGQVFSTVAGDTIKNLSDGPLITSEAEKIYQGSETFNKPDGYGSVPNSAWTTDLENNKHGWPSIAYTLYKNNTDNRFRLANWNGEQWIDREIAYAGPRLYEIEASYTGLVALDPETPSQLAISTNVQPNSGEDMSSSYEIYLANVSDKDTRETIEWLPLTSNSKVKNIRPTMIVGEGYKILLWMRGKFNHFEDFETNIVGQILERPQTPE